MVEVGAVEGDVIGIVVVPAEVMVVPGGEMGVPGGEMGVAAANCPLPRPLPPPLLGGGFAVALGVLMVGVL